jgi:hypothetical protein
MTRMLRVITRRNVVEEKLVCRIVQQRRDGVLQAAYRLAGVTVKSVPHGRRNGGNAGESLECIMGWR